MSAPHRPFLLRFTLALLGMLLLMAVGFAVLGWMVSRHQDWAVRAIGSERKARLWDWYLGFMANVLPGDQDGDGVCDGAELFLGSDPRNPMSNADMHASYPSQRTIIAYCGDRMTTRWVMRSYYVESVRWPTGFRAVVSADEPVLLPKGGGGSPTKGPLVVPMNARGEVEFDIMAEGAFRDVHVEFSNAANNKSLGWMPAMFPGWRTVPIPASIEGGPARSPHNHVRWKGDVGISYNNDLKWVAPDGWTGAYVIEAAREEGDGSWRPVATVKSTATTWSIFEKPWDVSFPRYYGPLKFRVMPVSPTPP